MTQRPLVAPAPDGSSESTNDDTETMTGRVHRYEAHCTWRGSTGAGYSTYNRSHEAHCPPAQTRFSLSADPTFGGDSERLNPEQLLLLAASSCQLLSFLAVAARGRIDVVAYDDVAEALMPEDERPIRISEISLHPTITVRPPVSEARVTRMVEVAHRECFIANSVACEITVTPTVTVLHTDRS
jgi:organic hydroperoxide reductase OsmC/OhrA